MKCLRRNRGAAGAFIQPSTAPLAENETWRPPLLHRWYSGLVQHMLNLQRVHWRDFCEAKRQQKA